MYKYSFIYIYIYIYLCLCKHTQIKKFMGYGMYNKRPKKYTLHKTNRSSKVRTLIV